MAQKQEMYWDEETQEYVVYEQPKKDYTAIYIVVYFLLLAMIVVPAQRFHMGMQGIFFAMVAAGISLGIIIFTVKFVIRRVQAMQLTKKGFIQMMVGVEPETTENATQAHPGSRALIPASNTAIIPLQGNDGPPDQIIQEHPMYIAEAFRPSVMGALGAMILLCGLRRSGKSNLLSVLAEELGQYDAPEVIFDTQDEYGEMVDRQYLPNPVHAGSPEYRRESPHSENYVELDKEGAYDFGRAILDGRLQAVVNLKSWSDDDAAIIMSEIIDGMNDWEEERDNENRIPVMVFLDEAQKWLPQSLRDGWVTRENQTLLHHAFFDIVVARGGQRGFGLVVATQRYSQLNKNVLQSQWKFLFRQTEEIDIGRYGKLGLPEDEIPALQPGECFIFSPLVIGFKTTVRMSYSPHTGKTPGLENLKRTRRAPADIVLRRSFSAMSAIDADPNVTRQLDTRLADIPENPRARTKTDLERVIEVYKENPGLSYREMGEKVGFGKDKVGELLKEAKERGLLD